MSISSEVINSQLVLHCPQRFNSEFATLAVKEVGAKLEQVSGVALNFKDTLQFETLVLLRCIGSLGKFLRARSKGFFAVNVSPEIATEIRLNGLDSAIKILAEGTAAPKARPKRGLNVEFINPFVTATVKTLSTQCNTESRWDEKPFLKGTRPLPTIDIAGIIGLTSKEFNGSISICFPKETFLAVMQGMLGEAHKEITGELEDGAGELLNIIFGQSKVGLNEKGFGIEIALPTVVRAQELSLRQYSRSPTLILLFSSPGGPFFLEIALDS